MTITDNKLRLIDGAFEIMLMIAFLNIFKHLLHINNSWLLPFLAIFASYSTAAAIYKRVEKTKIWAKHRSPQK